MKRGGASPHASATDRAKSSGEACPGTDVTPGTARYRFCSPTLETTQGRPSWLRSSRRTLHFAMLSTDKRAGAMAHRADAVACRICSRVRYPSHSTGPCPPPLPNSARNGRSRFGTTGSPATSSRTPLDLEDRADQNRDIQPTSISVNRVNHRIAVPLPTPRLFPAGSVAHPLGRYNTGTPGFTFRIL